MVPLMAASAASWLLPVLVTAAAGVRGRVEGGVAFGAGGGQFRGVPGALAVERLHRGACCFLGIAECRGLGFHGGDGLGGGCACLGGVELGGVPGGGVACGLGAGVLQLRGGLGAGRPRPGPRRPRGRRPRGELLADGGELVHGGGQLGTEPGHRRQGVVADGARPADRGSDRAAVVRLPGELGPAAERGQRGVPDQHRGAVAVLGDFPLAVAGQAAPGAVAGAWPWRGSRIRDTGMFPARGWPSRPAPAW